MPTDIEIARSAKKRPIHELAEALEIDPENIIPYGHDKAKIATGHLTAIKSKPNGKLILVTAITPTPAGEGKTTTSACLARTTAASGLRTLLIDSDFRRRGSSEMFGYNELRGLSDVLAETAPLGESLHIDPQSGLHILGIGAEGTTGELASPQALQKLLERARREYDVVVVDTGPILGVADARQICALADRVLLLSRWRETSVKAVEAAIDILEDSGASLAGIALTQVDVSRYASTGESDVFAYTRQFRGYYVS